MAQLCADAVIAVLTGQPPANAVRHPEGMQSSRVRGRVSDPIVLVVTSGGSSSAAVVPVLAAIEAAGMRVRAIDLGGAGGGGGGAGGSRAAGLLAEGAERRLRKELEASPPDAAVMFDPHAALALHGRAQSVQNTPRR